MTDMDIPIGDHICRYCKPSSIVDGKIMAGAFQIRKNENHLSVNWIEYLGVLDLASAADMISELLRDKNYRVKLGGRMAIIGVGTAMSATFDAVNKRIRIRHVPRPGDESHAGIFGYTHSDYEIAATLAKQAQPFRTS